MKSSNSKRCSRETQKNTQRPQGQRSPDAQDVRATESCWHILSEERNKGGRRWEDYWRTVIWRVVLRARVHSELCQVLSKKQYTSEHRLSSWDKRQGEAASDKHSMCWELGMIWRCFRSIWWEDLSRQVTQEWVVTSRTWQRLQSGSL